MMTELAIILISLTVGSFINLLIYRLPIMIRYEGDMSINLWRPRSFCPLCRTTIPAHCNIPILSYLFLRGRCATCKQRIGWQYPIVELCTVLLALSAAYYFGYDYQAIWATVFLWILLALFMIDIQTKLLPDVLTLGLLWLGLICNARYGLFIPIHEAIYACATGYMVLWSMTYIYYGITGKEGMGYGDFKLLAAFGAWFGFQGLVFILFLSSILGVIVGVTYLMYYRYSKDTPIPFGPFLCMVGGVYLFLGPSIIHWYIK